MLEIYVCMQTAFIILYINLGLWVVSFIVLYCKCCYYSVLIILFYRLIRLFEYTARIIKINISLFNDILNKK